MSVHIPRRGTRGSRLADMPRFLKPIAMWAFEQLTRLSGAPLGYLTTVGAKTGLERTVPLRAFDDGPGRWLVVASVAGSPKNPAWLHNLKAHPDEVSWRIGRTTWPVTPSTLSPAERDEVWPRIVREQSNFAGYQEATDRVIPVVRLTRRDA